MLYLRLNFGSLKKEFALGIKISDPSKFDDTKFHIKGGAEVAKSNLLISKTIKRATDIVIDADMRGEKLSPTKFEQLFKDTGVNNESFIEFARAEVKFMQSQVSDGYYRHMDSEVNKLTKYNPNITFSELDYEFLKKYERYMLIDLKNNMNTIGSAMKRLKTLIIIAIRKDKMRKNPFDDYKIKSEPVNRNFLTIDELNILNKLYDQEVLPPYLQKVLRYFLFSCYCGLRYTDVFNLTFEDIQLNQGHYFIGIEQHKTKDRVYIPMKKRAMQLIGDMSAKSGKIFKVNTNQVTNRFLKEIIDIAVINKEISFHCARHTFATVALSIGIDIKTISSLLGHTDLKTTQIYAKVLMSSKLAAMDKFDDI